MVTIRPNGNVTHMFMLTVAGMTLGSVDALAQRPLLDHPVFAKYPSPEQLQQHVTQFKREHAGEFEAARRDLELALRSGLELMPVSFADERQLRMSRKGPVRFWSSCSGLKQKITELEKANRSAQRLAFYRAHFDALCVEFSVALRMVALDILLNGWHDWSRWDTERLREYRNRYPDVYRSAAVTVLGGMNHELWQRQRKGEPTAGLEVDDGLRAQGVLLRMLADTQSSQDLLRRVRVSVRRILNDPDALDFVVKLALEGKNETARRNGRYCMGSLTGSLPLNQQRDFWVQYLDCDDDQIRSAAVEKVGSTIDLLKKDAKEQATNDQLAERLRAIAASDPDPRIRTVAQRRVRAYEDDSPPPGLITYEKEDN